MSNLEDEAIMLTHVLHYKQRFVEFWFVFPLLDKCYHVQTRSLTKTFAVLLVEFSMVTLTKSFKKAAADNMGTLSNSNNT